MTEFPAGLERLRQLRGIERCYTDFRGQLRELGDNTLRGLLAALGHRVDDEAALAAEAETLEQRDWVRVLPPAVVLRGARQVPVTVLAPLLPLIRWRIQAEDGEALSGEFEPGRLPVLGERGIRELWYVRLGLELPLLSPGYYRLLLDKADGSPLAATTLIVAPPRCYEPEAVRAGDRLWGLAVQLYTLRSARNWGIGDFTDLAGLAAESAALGADLVGLNPLHALFPADPTQCGPYSPSSRYFLNVLYIDPEAVPEYSGCTEARRLVATPGFQARLAALRAAALVDYAGVAACKLEVLRLVHDDFVARAGSGRQLEFSQFLKQHGEPLEQQALFDALQSQLTAAGAVARWQEWPAGYGDPHGPAAQAFLATEARTVEFHCWLQWIAAQQLEAAERRAREAGMSIGLYRDLAVSANAGGAETWSQQGLYARDATVGAPPDALAWHGQEWGIPPIHPDELRERAYRPFIRLLRANMGQGGALRIDHVMGLHRLWWVPRGCPPEEGGYVPYRLDELMAIVALESQRHRCLVIGEDLGTVPPEVRESMQEHGLYSYRVLFFEQDAEGFRRPAGYPRESLVTVTTHDLPPLASFWKGSDIVLRKRLGLYRRPGMAAEMLAARWRDRERLVAALSAEGLAPPGSRNPRGEVAALTPQLTLAIQLYLARSPAAILVVQPEDWLDMDTPVNVPGTWTEYPSWARKLAAEWPEWLAQPSVRAMASAIHAARRGRADDNSENKL